MLFDFIKSLIAHFVSADNWSVDNILSVISIFLVIIGGIFAYKQLLSSNQLKRAGFIKQI